MPIVPPTTLCCATTTQVADFGLSTFREGAGRMSTAAVGTFEYLAPELRLAGSHTSDAKADVYRWAAPGCGCRRVQAGAGGCRRVQAGDAPMQAA